MPVLGGSAGDNYITGEWRQFANGDVYSNGISLCAIYTDLKVGWAYEAVIYVVKTEARLPGLRVG